jgi:hypothetical protein
MRLKSRISYHFHLTILLYDQLLKIRWGEGIIPFRGGWENTNIYQWFCHTCIHTAVGIRGWDVVDFV